MPNRNSEVCSIFFALVWFFVICFISVWGNLNYRWLKRLLIRKVNPGRLYWPNKKKDGIWRRSRGLKMEMEKLQKALLDRVVEEINLAEENGESSVWIIGNLARYINYLTKWENACSLRLSLEPQLWNYVCQTYGTIFKGTNKSWWISGKVYSNNITDDRSKRADCYVKKPKHNFFKVASRFQKNIWKGEQKKIR